MHGINMHRLRFTCNYIYSSVTYCMWLISCRCNCLFSDINATLFYSVWSNLCRPCIIYLHFHIRIFDNTKSSIDSEEKYLFSALFFSKFFFEKKQEGTTIYIIYTSIIRKKEKGTKMIERKSDSAYHTNFTGAKSVFNGICIAYA
jgi:hypothetical protein